ncbi:hypothetical protein [Vibrio sp. ArtGut-C1]|uniref:hypothetical protein n=1 Tax=Vibrio sp. ArtGut-C1 TaxID=2259137 RepID=UPI0013DEFBC3|nr:hypothetical protein [Vibrio sp. ArtGut-C1]
MKEGLRQILLLLFLLVIGTSAFAENKLKSELQGFLVVKEGEEENLLPLGDDVNPGDVIEYHLIYKNDNDYPLMGVQIISPIPENTVYVKNSALSERKNDFSVSIDDGTTYDKEPIIKVVRLDNGQEKTTEIGPEEYDYLRWIPLDGIKEKEIQKYQYRVLVQ